MYVAVIGPGQADPEQEEAARQIASDLGRRGAVIVCGGLGGVMAAACQGAKSAGATTVGLLPGSDRRAANEWVDIAIPTGLGQGRNLLVARTADVVLAVGGGYGTLSEIAFALRAGIPVIGLGSWDIDGVVAAKDAGEAARLAAEIHPGSA